MEMDVDRILAFLNRYRDLILKRQGGRAELLSDEELGQLFTLNTIIHFIQHP